MSQLCEVMASDEYWAGPVAPEQKRLSVLAWTHDYLMCERVLGHIARVYTEVIERGPVVYELQTGEELGIDDPIGMLKVVLDRRVCPKPGAREPEYVSPDAPIATELFASPGEFDARARSMVKDALFRGSSSIARIATATGPVVVGRRVLYLHNSPSGRQLAGIMSDLLATRAANRQDITLMGRMPVGHVRSTEDRQASVDRRVVSAAVITARGVRRTRKVSGIPRGGGRLSVVPHAT